MACKGLSLITDKVRRCTEQAKITIPQHFSSSTSRLIFNNISNDIFGKVVLHDHHISNNWFLAKRKSFFNGCEVHMQQLSQPTTSQRLQWGNRQDSLKFLTMATFSDAVSEVTSHAWPPESFLHER